MPLFFCHFSGTQPHHENQAPQFRLQYAHKRMVVWIWEAAPWNKAELRNLVCNTGKTHMGEGHTKNPF